MGAITQAMAKAARARGVEIRTGAPVRELLIEKGRAAGVVHAGRRGVRARSVVAANVNPKLLYRELVAAGALCPPISAIASRAGAAAPARSA